MSIANFDQAALWRLRIEEFNEWRAANDIPILFDYFCNRLPGFQNWLDTFDADKAIFCRVIPTGTLFSGQSKKLLIEDEARATGAPFYKTSTSTKENLKKRYEAQSKPVPENREFEPYFLWAKKVLGRSRFFCSDKLNHTKTDTFEYNLWSSPVGQPEQGRASLFKDFEVLKLGGLTLEENCYIGGRNLDFCDLDFLEIVGEWHGSYALEISFSSARHVSLKTTKLHHWSLHSCHLEEFRCANSEIQNFRFKDCAGPNVRFSDSVLTFVTFENIKFPLNFSRCELRDIVFKPGRDQAPLGISTQYRRLRVVAQEAGMRQEASECFFNERVYERKALGNPYLDNGSKFPPTGYSGRLRDLYVHWEKGTFSNLKTLKLVASILFFHLKIWFYPKYFVQAIRFKFRYFLAFVDELVWGYGERPARILCWAAVIISSYAIYFDHYATAISWGKGVGSNIWEAIYFSTITFTTLGYGDVLPISERMKLACSSEALLGAFFVGLIVAGFSNRSRY